MKRVLCGALAVILAIGCLTGCQKSNEKNLKHSALPLKTERQ